HQMRTSLAGSVHRQGAEASYSQLACSQRASCFISSVTGWPLYRPCTLASLIKRLGVASQMRPCPVQSPSGFVQTKEKRPEPPDSCHSSSEQGRSCLASSGLMSLRVCSGVTHCRITVGNETPDEPPISRSI